MNTINTGRIIVIIASFCFFFSCSSSHYERYGDYVDGIALARNDEDAYSFIDTNGKLVNRKASFKYADSFSEGFAVVQLKDNSFAFVDRDIKVVSKEYNYISSFNNGYARYSLNGQQVGLIDTSLNEVLKPSYDSIGDFVEGFAVVTSKGKYGFINSSFQLIIPCKYDSASDFSDGYAIVNGNSFVDKSGIIITVNECDDLDSFKNGFAKARKRGSFGSESIGVINSQGTVIIPFNYNKILGPKEGLFLAHASWGGWSFLDENGNDPFNMTFDSASEFSNGIAKVVKNGVEFDLKREGVLGSATGMSIEGRWKHRDDVYGVYTIKIIDKSFELWYPNKMIGSGHVERNGNTLLLHDSSGTTYSVSINLNKRALEWDNKDFYRE